MTVEVSIGLRVGWLVGAGRQVQLAGGSIHPLGQSFAILNRL